MEKYKIFVTTTNGEFEGTIESKYDFADAVRSIALADPTKPIMFGKSLAFIAGSFLNARLIDPLAGDEEA